MLHQPYSIKSQVQLLLCIIDSSISEDSLTTNKMTRQTAQEKVVNKQELFESYE